MVAEEVRDGSVGRGREPGEEGGQVHLMQAGVDPRTFSPDTGRGGSEDILSFCILQKIN